MWQKKFDRVYCSYFVTTMTLKQLENFVFVESFSIDNFVRLQFNKIIIIYIFYKIYYKTSIKIHRQNNNKVRTS